jgi:nitrogen fixation NifU-like protein
MYRQQIIDHYKDPRNEGEIVDADVKSKKYNYSCGDEIEVFLKIKDDKVSDVKYKIRGCAISVAGASLLSEELMGMSISEIEKLDNEFIEELMGTKLTSSRIKCAMLGLDAIKEGLKNK